MKQCKTSQSDATTTWEKTRLSNLVRNKQSGRYYARAYANGKEVWKSLKTAHFGVAEAKLAEFLKEHRELRGSAVDPGNGKLTFLDAATLYQQKIASGVGRKKKIKTRTRAYYNEVLAALLRSWPSLGTTQVRRVTAPACREWAGRYEKAVGPTRYNNTIAVLRHVLDIAKENGIIYSNPAGGLKRTSIRKKQLKLPTRAQFTEFIAAMESAGGRDSRNCADFAQGLAFTGCRKGEAAEVELRDLDFDSGIILVKGTEEDGTKNGESRRVPMIIAARMLFERMLSERSNEPRTAKLFLVNECQKSMDRAAKLVGMDRITHHDLRHLFATICIESGVDVPTVSRWLGHKDGGALAMKTYGHLRDEHSVSAARKVSFSPIAAPADVIPFPATG